MGLEDLIEDGDMTEVDVEIGLDLGTELDAAGDEASEEDGILELTMHIDMADVLDDTVQA